MLGRRGPVQAAFTPPELQELGELAGADVIVDPADLVLDAASERALEEDRERARRNVELLHEYALRVPAGKPRTIRLRFLVSPVAILGDGPGRGRRDRAQRARRGGRPHRRAPDGRARDDRGRASSFAASATRASSCPACRSTPARATIPNNSGRVAGAERTYCAGWIKRGPSGVIGTNKKDATETVEELLADARAGKLVAATRLAGRSRRCSTSAGRRLRRVRGLAGDRRRRARRRRAARAAAREARQLGRAARNRAPALACSRERHGRDSRSCGAARRARRSPTSPSPASRSRFPSRAGSAGSRPPPRA